MRERNWIGVFCYRRVWVGYLPATNGNRGILKIAL